VVLESEAWPAAAEGSDEDDKDDKAAERVEKGFEMVDAEVVGIMVVLARLASGDVTSKSDLAKVGVSTVSELERDGLIVMSTYVQISFVPSGAMVS
jgi:hypothetical protein